LSEAIKKYTDKEPVIIPNWTNVDFIKPVLKPENPFVLTHRLLDKFIVMYSGNLGITHDLETIVSVAELLKNEKEIIFVIIGEGAKREKIARLIKEKELANLLLLPYQERETLPYSLGAADVGVITLGKGAEHVSVPSKTYYTLAAGAAVLALASPDSELGILIDEYACGKLFSGEQHNEIADFIYSLSKNKELLNQYRKNARVASLNFSPENAKTYYNEIKKI
jgi:glycosyltransferase involved in cell wall biosynthesis